MSEKKFAKEAHAYTPGLKIKKSEIIRRLRRLPVPGEVYVNKGDSVEFTTQVAQAMVQGDPYIINVTAKLGVENNAIRDYLKKREGDEVKKDENIAGFNAFFGLWKNWVTSPIDGFIETVSDLSGQVIVRERPHPVQIDAYISGKVVDIFGKEGAVVETNGALIQGIFGIGGETHGEIKVILDDPTAILDDNVITSECKDKIIVGGSKITKSAIQKCIQTGVAGIVTGGMMDIDLAELLGYEIGVAITGEEEIGLTLIITEGFGEMSMNPRTLDLFKSFNGQMAAMNGATQIRAGVIRPEVIIPHTLGLKAKNEDLAEGMIKGTPIRIIREPHFGALGVVDSLPIELQEAETESKVRVLVVMFPDGSKATVPRANVEIIET